MVKAAVGRVGENADEVAGHSLRANYCRSARVAAKFPALRVWRRCPTLRVPTWLYLSWSVNLSHPKTPMPQPLCAARELLPIFRANTVRGLQRTCGYYAFVVGRDVRTVRDALHLVGAACVLSCVPVAPVRYVEDVETDWRYIFQTVAGNSLHVGVWATLAAASRVYTYSESDFEGVAIALHRDISELAP